VERNKIIKGKVIGRKKSKEEGMKKQREENGGTQ
jgi:hypothetical protein